MAHKLFIDTANRKLVQSLNSTLQAHPPTLEQGTDEEFEIFLVKPNTSGTAAYEVVPFSEGASVSLAIGMLDARAVGGVMRFLVEGDPTMPISHDASSREMEDAINATPYCQANGGLHVLKSKFAPELRLTWDTAGERPEITLDSTLRPTCQVVSTIDKLGDASTRQIQTLRIKQAPACFTDIFSDTGFESKIGTLDTRTQALEDLIFGKLDITLTLQIKLYETGKRTVILNTPVKVENDLIDERPYTQTPLSRFYTADEIDALFATIQAGTTVSDIIADLNVGAINAGDTIQSGTTLDGFISKLIQDTFTPTCTPPSASLSSSIGTNVEAGTTGLTLTATLNRGAIIGALSGSIWNPSLAQGFRAGAATGYFINGQDTGVSNMLTMPATVIADGANTFSAQIDYEEGAQPTDSKGADYSTPLPAGNVTSSVTVNGRRKAFYGVDSTGADSAAVRALGANLLNPANGSNFAISIPIGATSVCFAYPATLRDVNSVKYVEGLNAEVKGIFTKTLVNVEGANGYSAQSYKVYRYEPVSPFSADATYNVTI